MALRSDGARATVDITQARGLALLNDVARALINEAKPEAVPDFTLRQLAILLTIYLDPPPHTVRGLAEKLGVTKPVVTRALDVLEQAGDHRAAARRGGQAQCHRPADGQGRALCRDARRSRRRQGRRSAAMSPGFDRRLVAARPDLAAAHLAGQVEAARFVTGTLMQVCEEVAPLTPRPSREAPLDTQVLYGETVMVYEQDEEGWAWGQLTRDDYVGYIPARGLATGALRSDASGSRAAHLRLSGALDKAACPSALCRSAPPSRSPHRRATSPKSPASAMSLPAISHRAKLPSRIS